MKRLNKSGFLTSIALASISLSILASCAIADEKSEHSARPESYFSSSLSGNYLSGRFAQRQQDWSSADNYIGTAAQLDSQNNLLQQRAFLLSIGAGNYEQARAMAEKILTRDEGNELAKIFLACADLKKSAYADALHKISILPDDGFGVYTKPLLSAWATAGAGQNDAAIALIETSASVDDASYAIHEALIKERSGKAKEAVADIEKTLATGLTVHNAIIVAGFFERQNNHDRARDIYAALPTVNSISLKKNTDTAPLTPAQGASIVLMDLASLLYERRAMDSAQIYGQISRMLWPENAPVLLMLGDIAASNQRFDTALGYYAQMPETSPFYGMSMLRSAEVMHAHGQKENARDLLQKLAQDDSTKVSALTMLGDAYRQEDQFKKAYESYDAAIKAAGTITAQHWPLFYARGMALERMNDWTGAEKDLMTALEYQPDNAMVLNYIGYSWAEKGIHLDKAEKMLQRAATLSPDDGYVLDSYGWVLYRLGRYDEAAQWLEKAVSLVPDDSSILSHVGDVYWQTGRESEARFKWKRAYDISQDADKRLSLKSKIAFGLDEAQSKVARQDQ